MAVPVADGKDDEMPLVSPPTKRELYPVRPEKVFTVERRLTVPADTSGHPTTRPTRIPVGGRHVQFVFTQVPVIVTVPAFTGGEAVRAADRELYGSDKSMGALEAAWANSGLSSRPWRSSDGGGVSWRQVDVDDPTLVYWIDLTGAKPKPQDRIPRSDKWSDKGYISGKVDG